MSYEHNQSLSKGFYVLLEGYFIPSFTIDGVITLYRNVPLLLSYCYISHGLKKGIADILINTRQKENRCK